MKVLQCFSREENLVINKISLGQTMVATHNLVIIKNGDKYFAIYEDFKSNLKEV